MRTIEIRRHSFTKKGEERGHGTHLSADGIRAARAVGDQIRPFHAVYTSGVQRTLETAVAMGFAVDNQVADLARMDSDFWDEVGRHDHWSWDSPYDRYAELLNANGPVSALADRHIELWRDFLDRAPDSSNVLVVSHGHAIEASLVAAVGAAKLQPFENKPFGNIDGVRLTYDGKVFGNPKCVRLTS